MSTGLSERSRGRPVAPTSGKQDVLDSPRTDRAALLEVRAIYRHADAAYAPYSCPASGECCQLSTTQRQPWLWEPEWRLVRNHAKELGLTTAPRADGGCPFLDDAGKRCRVYRDRPFGCRTFFCNRIKGPHRQPLEQVNALLQRLERVALQADPDAKGPKPLFDWMTEEPL